ncbi:MAG: hypothetical protein JWM75_1801, partial [Sphingomonas bacterium]|nr:hypothetical protein [Sphingomonas bacterium]
MPDSHRTPAPPLTLAATLAGELARQRRALGAAGPQFEIADLSPGGLARVSDARPPTGP